MTQEQYTTQEIIDKLKKLDPNVPISTQELINRPTIVYKKDSVRPSHYHDAPFNAAEVQEYVALNIMHKESVLPTHPGIKKGMWVSYAVKHLLRAGKKDPVDMELTKAINYLYKAMTGNWLPGDWKEKLQ